MFPRPVIHFPHHQQRQTQGKPQISVESDEDPGQESEESEEGEEEEVQPQPQRPPQISLKPPLEEEQFEEESEPPPEVDVEPEAEAEAEAQSLPESKASAMLTSFVPSGEGESKRDPTPQQRPFPFQFQAHQQQQQQQIPVHASIESQPPLTQAQIQTQTGKLPFTLKQKWPLLKLPRINLTPLAHSSLSFPRDAFHNVSRKLRGMLIDLAHDLLGGLFALIEGFVPVFAHLNLVAQKCGMHPAQLKILVLLLLSLCIWCGYTIPIAKYTLLFASIHTTVAASNPLRPSGLSLDHSPRVPDASVRLGASPEAEADAFLKVVWMGFCLQWLLVSKLFGPFISGGSQGALELFSHYETLSVLCLFLLLYNRVAITERGRRREREQRVGDIPAVVVPPTS